MKAPCPPSVEKRIGLRAESNALRTLSPTLEGVDFYSNDYLGFVTNGLLQQEIATLFPEPLPPGSTGSRLLSGDTEHSHRIEAEIAEFHGGESALLFNSGYDANVGLLSSTPTRHDTVLYDERSHASIKDGVRLSQAKYSWPFLHNNLDDLENKIKKAAGDCYVVVESVYSMHGDFAPLIDIADLCKKYGAYLIVDEAHSTGIFGPRGEGQVTELGLEQSVFARIFTFGKALGAHGAAIVGSEKLKTYA